MIIPVRIPTPLRKLTQNQEIVDAEGGTIRELIESLERTYPGLKERICDDQNQIRRFVNVFLNDEDVRFLSESETPVKLGDEVSIVPAIAGG
jgi:molybdopterin synthase sulfur carrier subunit